MLARWARFCGRRRYHVLFLWAAVLIASIPLAANVTHHLSSSGFEDPRSSAVWADNQLKHLSSGGTATLLIAQANLAEVRSWASAAGVPAQDVRFVEHGKTLLVPVAPLSARQVAEVRRSARAAHASVSTVDDVAVGQRVLSDAKATLSSSLPIALPLVLILLLLVFGSVASSSLPLIVAAVGSSLALAVIDLVENHMVLSSYLTDIVSFLALGVGVDYALFLSARFRQELQRTDDLDAAVGETMRTAGRSVLYSGIAVALAVATLLLGGDAYWRGIALGGAVAVASVLLATHSLLPALLRLIGRRIDWGRLPTRRKAGRMWPGLASFVGRHPIWAMLMGLALLGVPAIFGVQMTIRTPANLSVLLPRSDPLRKAVEVQAQALGPGAASPIVLAMRLTSPVTEPASWQEVLRVTQHVQGLADVHSVASAALLGLSPAQLAQAMAHPSLAPQPLVRGLRAFTNAKSDPHVVVVYVTPTTGPDSPATLQLVHALQKGLPIWLPVGSRSGVGGVTALLDGFNHLTGARLPWIIGGVALIAFLILLFATGSFLQPLLGVVFDGLVALATAGILVLTVQRGGFGFEALAPDSSITPLIFVLLFGLSMDYEVILLHRVQEFVRSGSKSSAAASAGLAATGSMITGAGMIMVVVFVALLVSPLEIMQMLAIGMTSAILLDTWIVRTLLVPGSIALLGRFAFWPWGTQSGRK
ncbi:MAG: MMPL family transporter [Thermaerobacter sp.]|nr:MMPL family transporter [Thermaerobacter sp.]